MYDNTLYTYRKNLLDDIIAVYQGSTKVAEYVYDAYGKCTVILNTAGIATINPFRYRSYYFDSDLGLYYLQSRYYDPETGRFINADEVSYLDPETINGFNLYAYCLNNPVMYVDPTGHFPVLALILGITALAGLGLTIGGVATGNNTLTAVGLTMVAIPALISGGMAIAAGIGGATLTGIVGGVTTVAGIGSGLFASAEYQEVFTGKNWMLYAGMSEDWYNGLMIATAALATAGTITTGILTSIGNAATPNQMMNSFQNNPNRWKTVKNLIEPGRKKYKGGTSTYSNYINKWTGSKLGIHKIIKGGKVVHGPHFHYGI